jgi:glycosyltransferase involved in cell wall biosynthesis
MLRVAHLVPSMVTGGRERIVADLCRSAGAYGIAPSIVCYDGVEPGLAQLDAGAPVTTIDRAEPDFAGRLRGWLAVERIDVLHAQGHIAAALARPGLGDTPMVASLHVALGSGWRWMLPIARGLRAAREVTAVSDDLARRFRPLAGRAIRVIPTGVDLERFRPRSRPASDVFTVGIAARFHPVKRHEDAIAALRLLHARGVGCRLRLAGQGPQMAGIAALARGLDVEFCGDVLTMPEWLGALDAFLLPSDHEGTPAALLEAMASGLPCIASAVGGVPALVGEAGLLVSRRDPAAIADAIGRLVADRGLRERLSLAAMRRAADYSMDRQAAAYAALYGQGQNE